MMGRAKCISKMMKPGAAEHGEPSADANDSGQHKNYTRGFRNVDRVCPPRASC